MSTRDRTGADRSLGSAPAAAAPAILVGVTMDANQFRQLLQSVQSPQPVP